MAQKLGRFQNVTEISLISRLFQIISRRKVKKMHRVQSLKAEEHFDAKNWVFNAELKEIEGGRNCC